MSSFFSTITEAVRDISSHGYDSVSRINMWMERIREAARRDLIPEHQLDQQLRLVLGNIYRRMIERGDILKHHAGISRFTLQQIKPHLRTELDRRIIASANLIKINRKQAIEMTLRRFQGWATSIPAGGSKIVEKVETKDDIRKSLAELPFVERRVLIDQGHKMTASLNNVLATENDAIAFIWHSHWRQSGYNYRKDHKKRDQRVYTIRGNWAADRGFMRASEAGYSDQITQVAEEPFCRCFAQYLYNLRDLPDDMLTEKGRVELRRVRSIA